MRQGGWQQAEEANLQADVMRFMAIVAFCLIAILAMVRQTQPQTTAQVSNPAAASATTTAEMPTPTIPTEPTPESVPEPIIKPTLTPKPQAKVLPPAQPPKPTPKPVEPPANKPAVVHTQPPRSPKPAPTPAVSRREPIAEPTPEPPATEQGLSLRFTSETDFLRLLSKGAITLYAYTSNSFQQLDKNYHFVETPPPAQVYELEAATIPNTLTGTLPAALTEHAVTWAVSLPPHVQQQIQRYLTTVKHGQLLINRYEEVTHVPAAS